MIVERNTDMDRAVGVQLQNLRIFRTLTREDAALKLSIENNLLAEIEDGRLRPTPHLLLKMASVYAVPASRVFSVAMHTPDVDSSM